MRKYGRYGRLYEKTYFDPNDTLEEQLVDYSGTSNINKVKELLEKGADPNAGNYQGKTALWKAAINNRLDVIKLLLQYGADINAKNEYGETALLGGAIYLHPEVVDLLLKKGADPNTTTYWKNESVLEKVITDGHGELLWSTDVSDYKKIEKRKKEVIRLLLEAGANIDPDNIKIMKYLVNNNLDYLVK